MPEPIDTRKKRLKMRSMRRGIKEMDLILSGFADVALADMDDAQLDHYEALLDENDHDLYSWVSGQAAPPPQYDGVIRQIAVTFQPLAR